LNFYEFSLNEKIQKAIAAMDFIEPTPVQEQVIPLLLNEEHRDLVGLSQTGTGKTAAFGLPLLETLDFSTTRTQALVLCPTRELCMQIDRDMHQFSKFMDDPGIIAVYGGAGYRPQISALRRGARIIIATPGRLRDLMEKGEVDLSNLAYLVLDEADTMLNMGFKEELDEILADIPAGKQTLLFSATMPPEVARIAKSYMNNTVETTMGFKNAGAANIEHRYFMVHARDKFPALKRLADYYPGIYGIVFCRTRIQARELAEKLAKEGYNADALHGDLSQPQRESIMEKFRSGSLSILVATDIAARGLDVQNLTHVIHYDLPDDMEVYNHRSGRTGRAGKSGQSLAIINMKERFKIRRIEQLIRKPIIETPVPGGREICEQQLMNLVDKIRSTDYNGKLIEPFLPMIADKLEGMDKEDVIKRVFSMEFNRFLSYYGNVPDLSPVVAESRRKESSPGGSYADKRGRDRGRGGDRNFREGSRGDRYESSDRRSRGKQPGVADRRDGSDRGRDRGKDRDERSRPVVNENDFTWLTINLGANDRFGKKDLLGVINQQIQGRQVTLGKIVTESTYTRFQVPKDTGDLLEKSLSRISVLGKRIRIKG
jgi:ATP-dependent RNA helicase DeaD